ncbi:hypothetical protein HRbin21_00208 [bacterium HR21]|nr:hypothetical protein HRbin21_00208 [bacterium HR21]
MLVLWCLLIAISYCSAQHWERGWVDTVLAFRPGTGQSFGREFFPDNIFGPPDTAARPDRPSADPRQLLSLGMDGEIIVGFRGKVLVNGPGPDLVIFENAFRTPTGTVFSEPGIVSVSPDGIRWHTFPWDSLTLRGCAGMTPTNGAAADFFDPEQSGGDWFDLGWLGVDTIRYIRITDLTWWLAQHPEHPLWNPILSGFDLDAVGGRYLLATESTPRTSQRQQLLLSEPCVPSSLLGAHVPAPYQIFTLEGRLIAEGTLEEWLCLPVHRVPLVVRIGQPAERTWWLVVWM